MGQVRNYALGNLKQLTCLLSSYFLECKYLRPLL